MTIWTQRARVTWRQSLSFLEHRYAVLRQLEDDGILRRFQERDRRISVRLGGAYQLLSFGPNDCSFSVLKPDLDDKPMRDAVEIVFSALTPRLMGELHFGFQSLVALDRPYDEACSAAATALLGTRSPLRLTDFALLLDGAMEEPLGECRLEIGVVKAAEVPMRFARVAGRVGRPDQDMPPTLWQPEELPDVALLGDIDVRAKLPETDLVENLFTTLASARDAADQLVSWFEERLEFEEP